MNRIVTITFSLSLLLGSFVAHACTFDTDCDIGSKCMKTDEAIHGACVGGLFPGNSNDSNPGYSVGDGQDSYGNTCSFDSDCGTGSSCVKNDGVFGACM